MTLLNRALAAIDAANGEDPNRVESEGGAIAKEVLYSQRMSTWLVTLETEASEELQLACRAQHIRRWESPRSDYPQGRAGYKLWRADLLKRHAATTETILQEIGYSEAQIQRVSSLLKKLHRSTDREAQTLEDVACLVFLAHEFDAFAAKHDDEKLIGIVQKTWKKMSPRGHQAALSLSFSGRVGSIVERALAPK